jgi:hypothetical protein
MNCKNTGRADPIKYGTTRVVIEKQLKTTQQSPISFENTGTFKIVLSTMPIRWNFKDGFPGSKRLLTQCSTTLESLNVILAAFVSSFFPLVSRQRTCRKHGVLIFCIFRCMLSLSHMTTSFIIQSRPSKQ